MFSKEIEDLLHKSLSAIPVVTCQKTLRHDIDDLVAMVFPGMKLAVVADSNTELALAADVQRALKSRFSANFVFLEGVPNADMATVEYVRAQTRKQDALIAVGSGTINDLCKYAAFLDGKPYLVFPTAASMNGYLSANASISVGGFKTTCKAAMPQAVFCDLNAIAAAPARLSKSGLGDSLARPTAQADWLLSHVLLGTPYDETPFALLGECEPVLFDSARGIAKNDPKTIELLVQALLLSGLGMSIAGGSYPASQGEHMIAHAYEMIKKTDVKTPAEKPAPTLHGEEIGVTALTMAYRQEKLLHHSPRIQMQPFPADKIASLFGERVKEEAKKAYHTKLEIVKQANPEEGWKKRWEQAVDCIMPIALPPKKIEAILLAAEAPTTIEALGWSPVLYPQVSTLACFLRERFTFLDIA